MFLYILVCNEIAVDTFEISFAGNLASMSSSFISQWTHAVYDKHGTVERKKRKRFTVDKCRVVSHRVAIVNRFPVSWFRDWIDPPYHFRLL